MPSLHVPAVIESLGKRSKRMTQEHNVLAKRTHGACKVLVHYDENPVSPRDDDECLGKILYKKGSRYVLGDEAVSAEEILEAKDSPDTYVYLLVFAYIHSGVCLRTGADNPFSAQDPGNWDSGCSGIIFATKEMVRRYYGLEPDDALPTKERVAEALRDEVKTYSQFLEGEVYAYTIRVEDEHEEDHCGGYYSMEDAENEAMRVAKSMDAAFQTRDAVKGARFRTRQYLLLRGLWALEQTPDVVALREEIGVKTYKEGWCL